MRYKEFYSTKKQGVAEGWKEKAAGATLGAAALGGIGAGIAYSPMAYVDGKQIHMAMPGKIPDHAKLVTDDNGKKIYVWKSYPIKKSPGNTDGRLVYRPAEDVKEGMAEGSLNEFAIDNDGRNDGGKFIPWKKFIEQLKQILAKDFDVNENIIKDTIKANFIPHDPMEFGPTVLYSYYDRRPGRNSGAFSTRGAIQVGKYFPGLRTGENKLLTAYSILKGHPFERHFDLTFDNIYKIANIIKGNTKGAYQMQSQGVAEATGDEKFDTMLGNIVKDTPTDFVLSHPVTGELFKRGFTTREQAKAYNQQKEQGYYSVYSYQWWRDEIEPEIPSSQKKGMAEGNTDEILAEKAKSKAQQRFFGMAHALQKGEKIPGASKELTKVAKTMGKKDVKDFAKTKRKGLPAHVKKD